MKNLVLSVMVCIVSAFLTGCAGASRVSTLEGRIPWGWNKERLISNSSGKIIVGASDGRGNSLGQNYVTWDIANTQDVIVKNTVYNDGSQIFVDQSPVISTGLYIPNIPTFIPPVSPPKPVVACPVYNRTLPQWLPENTPVQPGRGQFLSGGGQFRNLW